MDFLNINSNLIKNFNSTIKSEENNKVKAKVLFANKDSLIVNYRGKVLLLENKSNVPLKPGMIIYLSFDQVQNNSKNQILTKALGQIVENMFNLSLMINDSQMNFDIELTNIPDNKKASFIKWLSDFFTTLDKNIPDKLVNIENMVSNDKIKFMLKNIIEDIAKNFTKNKTINPDPIQFAKNIAKKLFSFIIKEELNTSEKNLKSQVSKQNNVSTSNNNSKKSVINSKSPINIQTNIDKKNNIDIFKNIKNQQKNNSTSKTITENITKKETQTERNNSKKTKISINNITKNLTVNKSIAVNVSDKKIITLLKSDNLNQKIDKSQLKQIIDNFIKSTNSNKTLFVLSNSKNIDSIDSLSKFIMAYKKSNEVIFINDSDKNLIKNNNNKSKNLIFKSQKPLIKYLDPKVIVKTAISRDINFIQNLNKNNHVLKSENPINKIFVKYNSFSNKNNMIDKIKNSIIKISNNLKNNDIKTTNSKNILILNSNNTNPVEETSIKSFKLLFNHDNIKQFDENLKNIFENITSKDDSSKISQNNLLNNTVSRAISAYQNMEGMKNLSNTSYMMFNMLGIPVYLSFNKEEIVQNENNTNTKSYGKIRLILPTETFGVTDINLFLNEKDAFINIKMQKNTDIFEKDLEKLKKNIESHNININSLSIKQDTELINIEREISVF
jgi:hypothetical protein